jgi:FixJ family two-component response regulator
MKPTLLDSKDRTLIHILDDDPGLRRSPADLLESALRGSELRRRGRLRHTRSRGTPGRLIPDMRPGMSGLGLQEKLGRDDVDLPIILMKCIGDVPTSVREMKSRVGRIKIFVCAPYQKASAAFLRKPFDDAALLCHIAAAIRRS